MRRDAHIFLLISYTVTPEDSLELERMEGRNLLEGLEI